MRSDSVIYECRQRRRLISEQSVIAVYQSEMGARTCLLGLALLAVCLGALGDKKYDEKDGRHNITAGARRFYSNGYYADLLLIQDNPKLSGSWFPYPRVQSLDVCYTSKNTGNRMFSITAFNVTDQLPKDEGGLAYVTGGGVSSGKLCLHLKTQRGKGYFFNINIWGFYI